jgi:NDP-sugar pyrophosphorylase family protein
MKGIVIAGGFGTRLHPLTYNRPKHLLPVGNRPFLEYQVALMRRHGIDEVVFATNFGADQIEAHFGDGSAFGVHMRYAIEDEPLGTAGAIRNAASLVPDEPVIVFNGDILTDFDLAGMMAFHRAKRALATIALRPVARPHGFGALVLDDDNRVQSWHEPSEAEKKAVAAGQGTADGRTDFINAGIYLLQPEVVRSIPTGRAVSVERETFPALIAETRGIFGTAPSGFWLDIGRPDQYRAANAAVLGGLVDTDVPACAVAEDASVDPAAGIDVGSSIGSRSIIGADAVVSGSIILQDVTVGARVRITNSIIDAGCRIADDVVLNNGVVASGTVLERGSRL